LRSSFSRKKLFCRFLESPMNPAIYNTVLGKFPSLWGTAARDLLGKFPGTAALRLYNRNGTRTKGQKPHFDVIISDGTSHAWRQQQGSD
jgi:hypothetical protein